VLRCRECGRKTRRLYLALQIAEELALEAHDEAAGERDACSSRGGSEERQYGRVESRNNKNDKNDKNKTDGPFTG
jgi:hypothetical protein